MRQQIAATDSAQDSDLTTVATWFELDQIRSALEESEAKRNIEAIMNKAVNQPNTEIEVSWWDIDEWADAVNQDNDSACDLISELSDETRA